LVATENKLLAGAPAPIGRYGDAHHEIARHEPPQPSMPMIMRRV
jgi:hypothetical protein